MQEQSQTASTGSKGSSKGGKSSDKGVGGFGKSDKDGKRKAVSLAGVSVAERRDTASRITPRLVPLTMTSQLGMRRRTSSSVSGGDCWWLADAKTSEESVSIVGSAWLLGDDVRGFHERREPNWHHKAVFCLLHESEDRTCMVGGADDEKLTREAQLKFCEADVRKPLASAVRVAKAINNIWLEANGGYIVNRGR